MASKNQPRRASAVDGNAAQIVKWLREDGAYILSIDGTFDVLVGMYGRFDIVEFKLPKGTVKQSQVEEMVKIAAAGLPPVIIGTDRYGILEEMKRRSKHGI